MAEQLILWLMLLLMPYRLTVNEPRPEVMGEIRQGMIQLEVETRAYRQKRSGGGL